MAGHVAAYIRGAISYCSFGSAAMPIGHDAFSQSACDISRLPKYALLKLSKISFQGASGRPMQGGKSPAAAAMIFQIFCDFPGDKYFDASGFICRQRFYFTFIYFKIALLCAPAWRRQCRTMQAKTWAGRHYRSCAKCDARLPPLLMGLGARRHASPHALRRTACSGY